MKNIINSLDSNWKINHDGDNIIWDTEEAFENVDDKLKGINNVILF
jgi:hypothetical protein